MTNLTQQQDQRVARSLRQMTPAMKRAIRDAWQSSWGEWFVPAGTRWDVRDRLLKGQLLSRRSAMPLRQLALDCRASLLSNKDQ